VRGWECWGDKGRSAGRGCRASAIALSEGAAVPGSGRAFGKEELCTLFPRFRVRMEAAAANLV
jgi:hypothetical protein